MVANQTIEYAPQCGDLTVKSLTFHNNNVFGVFRYPETALAYHEICKYLINCPLAEAFTKTPSVVYQNLLKDFWCTIAATHPNPHVDTSEVIPFKEYKFKFSVMNGKKPLTFNYKTFFESTGLDYAKGTYVSHPSPEVVKAELAKIAENPILSDRTPVLDGNYSSTEQVNSIQQLFAYCPLTGTKGPEAPGSLPQKRKKPKSKKTPIETKVTPPPCQQRVLSNPTQSPRTPYLIPKIQRETYNSLPADKGLPSMAFNKGTAKTMPCPEGPLRDKDSGGNKPPADMKLINPTVTDPSGTGVEYQVDQTQSTRLRYQTLTKNKGKISFEVESDPETLQLTTLADIQAYLLSEDELAQESDEEETFSAGDEMEEDTQADEDEHQASVEGYYEENIAHRDQTDKLVEAFMSSLEKSHIAISDLYTCLNIITELLKDIKNAIKDDHALNKKVIEATEAYTKNSSAITELLNLVKNFDFQGLKSLVESLQAAALRQDEHLASWTKPSKVSLQTPQEVCHGQHLLSLKGQQMLGENVTQADTKEPPSHTEGEHVTMEDDAEKPESDKADKEPTRAVPISTDRPPLTDPICEIPTPELVPASKVVREDPDEPIRVPYMINGKMHYLTNDEINAYLENEDKIKKAAEEAKMFETQRLNLVPSCFTIFDLEHLSFSFDFVFMSEIFKSLSFCRDCLCLLEILCLDQHARTLHHLESLLTISLDRLDILKEDLVYQS
ncbi:hypothetical protein Tco_0243335 [Tanacetum coccineum]